MDSASQESAPEATPGKRQLSPEQLAKRRETLAKAREVRDRMAQANKQSKLKDAPAVGSPIMGGHGGTSPVVQVAGKPLSTVPVTGIRITERVIHVQGQRVQQVIGRPRTSIVTISAR